MRVAPMVMGFPYTSPTLSSPLSPSVHITQIVPLPNLKRITSSLHDREATRVSRDLCDVRKEVRISRNSDLTGVCRASQAFDLFPSACSEIVVRDARLDDCWDVADTHCSSFFPNYIFPLDLVLRIDRFAVLLSGFSVPSGCMRACLVAITGCAFDDSFYLGSDGIKVGDFEGKFSFTRGSVAGILTVDTMADFLPRKGPFQQRRTGIAYISNVAVREAQRRKGIAKRLIANAEARALTWGCHAMALHCETSNLAAARLYRGHGFRTIRVPDHANWPQPSASSDTKFLFMMKLLTSNSGQDR